MDTTLDHQSDMSPQWSVLRLRGDDALTFLQGQVTCDVTGETGVGALLAPSSEVLTDFSWHRIDDGVALVIRRECGELALARLKRFALRVAVSFELEPVKAGPYASVVEQIDRGLPGPAEFAAGLSPRSYGDAFVSQTVSFTKGCYTGQELVGRLDARNANVPYRVLRFVAGPGADVASLLRLGPEGGIQGVTTLEKVNDELTGFAVVHRTVAVDEVAAQGVKLTPLDYLVDAS